MARLELRVREFGAVSEQLRAGRRMTCRAANGQSYWAAKGEVIECRHPRSPARFDGGNRLMQRHLGIDQQWTLSALMTGSRARTRWIQGNSQLNGATPA